MAKNPDSYFGPIPPYGVAIREATSSGDATRMQQAGDAARRWLEQNAGHPSQAEVLASLRQLDAELGRS